MRTTAILAILAAAACGPIDVSITTSEGDGSGWTNPAAGEPETTGSTGIGASESGEPATTTSTGSTTGAAEHCAPSPTDGSCTCVVYDSVCACPNGHYPSSTCVDACACDIPDDELPCGLVVMEGHPTCTCVDTPADPAECDCAMVGDVCACGANIYPPETCSML